ncbi:hypothetical protein AB0E83_09655 [Streptomyces sp. NPDC035033]|uniref:hypothetical protein n=1 Tax=Streptomyces sp. NPDC035033 TaxID=3155368 RepID=UPI0033CE5E10
MYGPTPAPAPRPGGSSAGAVAVRVLLTVLVVVSLGLLAWVATLRIAIMRRTGRDWAVFWAHLALNIGCVVPLEQRFADTWMNTAGMIVLLVQMVAVVCYYLIVDTRHHHTPAPVLLPAPPPPHAPAYGYPPAHPATAVTVPNPYAQQPPHPDPRPYAPVPPAAVPAPPPSPRIDQVRAELDELSDLLRKEGEK